MNVLFVSQCTKRALTETRRILDQFAERRGERTWQTPITQAGLDTVRRLLRQTARKNTAVACHWIRGRDHSDLLWVVGDARQFNEEGATPTNMTASDVLRADDESTWHCLPVISALSALAALMHDLGKATQAFQERLKKPVMERNHYRHEWVSVRLFQAFIGDTKKDEIWLERLAACAENDIDPRAFEAQWLGQERLWRDEIDSGDEKSHAPFAALPPLAQAVVWLMLTHHRLPCHPVKAKEASAYASDDDHDSDEQPDSAYQYRPFGARMRTVTLSGLVELVSFINADWNEPRENAKPSIIEKYWNFPHGLPVTTVSWRRQAARFARKLLACARSPDTSSTLGDPFVMHVSRLCLMLADHYYSSLHDKKGEEERRKPYRNADGSLHANTHDGKFNQTLDEHLLGVQAHASLIARSLPTLAHSLPALRNHRGLKKRSTDARFQWQDKSADLAAGLRQRAAQHGAFIVSMASTGCGKTLGNARIMNALADPQRGLRCAFAIGLRTLTMQTGRSFQDDLGLSDEYLAIQVGGAASRALFEYWETQAEETGSASTQGLLDEGAPILFEGHDQHPLLQRLTSDAQVRSLIAAPLLACTVDHLTPATESLRGGRQIAPMLRLMTSDLVLDEPDDFDMADLPALTRLVHWAGLLGARVLLSSATLPPALVSGLYLAYLDGRRHYQRNRGERPDEAPRVACLWVDEFAQRHADCANGQDFTEVHNAFVQERCNRLARVAVRRRAQLVTFDVAQWTSMAKEERRTAFARLTLQRAWELHRDAQNHNVDPVTGKRVSFGLIRMANIGPLFDVALAMYRLGASVLETPDISSAPRVRFHLCVYHSQFPLLARSSMEHQLDGVFTRHREKTEDADPVFLNATVRRLLDDDACAEPDQIFIVLASPVCEVGRDWDADWAIAEPSSMRSLIQLAGRVRRHRPAGDKVERANIAVFNTNLRYFERNNSNAAVFEKPGFEMKQMKQAEKSNPLDSRFYFHLKSHCLTKLLNRPDARDDDRNDWPIDAQPRIRRGNTPDQQNSLVDLEHLRMYDTMQPHAEKSKVFTPARRDATLHWHSKHRLWLTGLLPQLQRFRDDSTPREDLVLLPTEDEDALCLHRIVDKQNPGSRERKKTLYVNIDHLKRPVHDFSPTGPGIGPWCHVDLLDLLRQWAENHDQSLPDSAKKVATVSLPESVQGWRYHPVLGFTG